jgi:hypothetical protein
MRFYREVKSPSLPAQACAQAGLELMTGLEPALAELILTGLHPEKNNQYLIRSENHTFVKTNDNGQNRNDSYFRAL